MRVQPKQEIFFNGIWYRPGDLLPKDYIEIKEEIKPKKGVKNASNS
jgi:hypothetical protein